MATIGKMVKIGHGVIWLPKRLRAEAGFPEVGHVLVEIVVANGGRKQLLITPLEVPPHAPT